MYWTHGLQWNMEGRRGWKPICFVQCKSVICLLAISCNRCIFNVQPNWASFSPVLDWRILHSVLLFGWYQHCLVLSGVFYAFLRTATTFSLERKNTDKQGLIEWVRGRDSSGWDSPGSMWKALLLPCLYMAFWLEMFSWRGHESVMSMRYICRC